MSSNISFGNIYRLNVPVSTADKIVCKLQADENFKEAVGNKLGIGERGMYPFNTFPAGEDKSYFFTGKESERFFKSWGMALDERDFARNYCKSDDALQRAQARAMERHTHRAQDIVEYFREKISDINVKCGKNGEIMSIDLIG